MTRIAVFGTSPITARAILGPAKAIGDVEIVLVGRDPEKTARIAGENGIARWSTSRAEVLAEGGIDVAYVALPNALHAEAASDAARAGIDILIEKPICLSSGELAEIAHAADAGNAFVREAVMIAHHGWLDHIASVVRDGTYGSVLRTETEIFFDPDAARLERMPPTRSGGGALYDVISYWLTITQRTLGLDAKSCSVEVVRAERGRDLEVRAAVTLSSGVAAALTAGFGRFRAAHAVHFERGSLSVDSFLGPAAGRAMLYATARDEAGQRSTKLFPPASYYDAQLRAFLADRSSHARGSAGLAAEMERARVVDELMQTLFRDARFLQEGQKSAQP